MDPKPKVSGWSVIPFTGARPLDTAVALEEYATDAGPADNALADRGQLLGVVEAKKLTVGPSGVLTRSWSWP